MTPNHSTQVAAYFEANKHKYNFETVEGCGKYTEDCVRECLRMLDVKWGLLKYNGSGTKYNGHRIDSILYSMPNDGDTNLRSIDIITNAESDHASSGWTLDSEARYTHADWIPFPVVEPVPQPNKVTREYLMSSLGIIHNFYGSESGLMRNSNHGDTPATSGIIKGATLDLEALGSWIFNIMYDGWTIEKCIETIKQSDEYKTKHGIS